MYRWGEDGLLGITDRECRMCFCLALWNGKDPILKERLFGLTGNITLVSAVISYLGPQYNMCSVVPEPILFFFPGA